MARLLDSVAPEVQTISLGSALTSAATCSRASSTAASASQPKLCERDAGLPNFDQVGNHFFRNARVDRGGCRVIQVDGEFHRHSR
jgi:hypothetical protein